MLVGLHHQKRSDSSKPFINQLATLYTDSYGKMELICIKKICDRYMPIRFGNHIYILVRRNPITD